MREVVTVGCSGDEIQTIIHQFDWIINKRLEQHKDDNMEILQISFGMMANASNWYKYATIAYDKQPVSLCPQCEENEVTEDDYLCKDCR